MKHSLFCTLFVLYSITLSAQTLVSGYVFEDANRNGKKDRKEKGLPNVAVSNGIDVVLTDSKGYYQLPLSNDNIIFVIKPTGYITPLKSNGLPDFYYIHKPAGSPDNYKFPAVKPTGQLPSLVNFALYSQNEPEEYSVLLFGDPQPYSLNELDHFKRAIVDELNDSPALFGISLGDIAGDNLELHQPYVEVMQALKKHWYNVIGNHDSNIEATEDHLSDESFESLFGPANYSFNYGKVHFIILDDIIWHGKRPNSGPYTGGFRADQLEFIKNDLAYVPKDNLVVLAFHIPLNHKENAFRTEDRKKLFSLLKEYPYTLSLSAHTHKQSQFFHYKDAGWLRDEPHHEYNVGTTNGDWYSGEINQHGLPDATMRDGTPQGYAYLRIAGNKYTIDYKVAGKPEAHQMKIYNPKVVPHRKNTSAGIFVNFFMGGEKDNVECRVDEGEWRKMNRVQINDPYYLSLLYKWDTTEKLMPGRRPSRPDTSTHLWRLGIPTNLPIGEHVIEVRVTDMFGRCFIEKSKYNIE